VADNVPISAGTGTNIATDDVGGAHYQRVKLADGTDGGTDLLPGTAARGLAVDPRRKLVRLAVTPTVSTTPAYAAKDAVGALMTFSNAVRASGGSGRVVEVQLVDKGQQMKDLELILFDRSITAPTDNAIFDPTDTEAAQMCGRVTIGGGFYSDFNDNSVADVPCDIPFVLNGTDLFGVLVARETPTYTSTSDIVVTITVEQD
jgi:hypothetical protein